MRSTASLFNKTLFKNDLKRLWPVWVVLSIISVLVGFVLLYNLQETAGYGPITHFNARSDYFRTVSGLAPCAAFVLACIVTASVWGFLYTGKSTVFFHSVPISRNAIFITNTITSFVIMIIPMLVGWLTYTIGTVAMKVFDLKGMLICLWGLIAETVIMLGISTFCAQVTGRLAAMVLLDLSANVFFAVAESILTSFASNFYYGVRGIDDLGFYVLSPVVALLTDLVPKKDRLEGVEYLTYYAIAGLVILLIAFFIYKIRKSEAATEVIAFKPMKPILLYSYATVGTILATWILYYLFSYSNRMTYNFGKVILFAFISGTLAYFVGRMFIERTVKVLSLKYIPGYCIMMVLLIAGIFVISLDPFNEEKWVPDKESVRSVGINSNLSEIFIDEVDGALITDVTDLHRIIALEGERYSEESEGMEGYIVFTYHLTDGRTKVREYRFPVYEENLQDPASVETALNNFYNLYPVREKVFHIGNEFTYESAWIYVSSESGYVDVESNLSEGEGLRLKEALQVDLREGNIPKEDLIRGSEGSDEERSVVIDLCDWLNNGEVLPQGEIYNDIGGNSDNRSYTVYHSFVVTESMTATRAFLEEIGAIE